MCNTCNHINVYNTVALADPTRTTVLRNTFVRDMNKRFGKLMREIKTAIVTNDCFGLMNVSVNVGTPYPAQFDFPTTSEKVAAFMEWLNQLVRAEILGVSNVRLIGTSINAAWTNKYIYRAYTKGVTRAIGELRRAGYDVSGFQDITSYMLLPVNADRVGVLYSRVYSELKGITDAMDKQISVVLSESMIGGDGPRVIARKLNKVVTGSGGNLGITDSLGRYIPAKRRAIMLARTEVIRAHHLATIQEYRNFAASGVLVQAEWSTAGDDRVCEECMSLQGKTFSLDEIQSMIPVHPQCRCIALPTTPKN